jgi:hypothetical protein
VIELLINLSNPIPKLQHAPLPLNCCKPGSAPQLFLFSLFIFELVVESIKELGGASYIPTYLLIMYIDLTYPPVQLLGTYVHVFTYVLFIKYLHTYIPTYPLAT